MYTVFRKLFIFLLACLPQLLFAGSVAVRIANQNQFDAAVERVNKGEEMHLVLCKGRYKLKTSMTAKAPLSIKGNGAIITSTIEIAEADKVRSTAYHNVYRLHSPLSLFPLLYDKKGDIIPISESVIDTVGVNYIEGEIVAPNEYGVGVSLKIPISSNLMHLRNKTFPCAFGYFDCGWRTVNFRLERADAKYFYCTTLTDCPTNNYQYDKKAYKKPIRYVLYNVEPKEGTVYFDSEYVYIPKNVKSAFCLNNSDAEHQVPKITTSSDIRIENVQFVGFGGVVVNSKIKDCCEIVSCSFSNTLNTTLTISKKNGEGVNMAHIRRCTFKYCSLYYDNMIVLSSSFDKRTCISISDCEITRYPDGDVMYKNTKPTVSITGDALVDNNVFYNNCRGHLGLNRGSIIVRNNVIYNTDDFNAKVARNLSNDWGLIYCNHVFKETDAALNNTLHHILIEKNLLYGAYAWGGDARGIFIDDGRGDVYCAGNVILNTQIYSIDARNSKLTSASSVRNRFENNILTSRYRLVAGEAVKGANVPSIKANTIINSLPNMTGNVQVLEDDQVLVMNTEVSCAGSKIVVNKELYKFLKKSPSWRNIKKSMKYSNLKP